MKKNYMMLKNIAFCFVFLGISALFCIDGAYGQSTVLVKSSNPSYTLPAGAKITKIECWGGGGAGRQRALKGGYGGGGGGYASVSVTDIPIGATLNITVGAGGAKAGDNQPGGNGGNTSVSYGGVVYVGAYGGRGGGNNGSGGDSYAAGIGGNGGWSDKGLPITSYKGGNGGDRYHNSTNTIKYSGGGGSGAGSAQNGNNGQDATLGNINGEGGASAGDLSGAGSQGHNWNYNADPGGNYGGGGGGTTNGTAGKGGPGVVRITYTQTSVTAKNDYGVFKVDAPTTVNINPLANDVLSNVTLSNLVVSTNPAHGTVVKSGNNFIYTPSLTSPQSDSFTYTVTAGGISKTATVYILALNTNADNYTVCPGDQISLEADSNAHFTYKWYNAASDGSLLYTGNPYLFTKSGSATQTVYLQAVGGGHNVGSRLAVHIDGNSFCGSTSEQNCSGTVLFSEDFGGNNTSDPTVATSGTLSYGGSSGLSFSTAAGSGSYSLIKHWDHSWCIDPNFDHTYLGDNTKGYFMSIDPFDNDFNRILYDVQIKDLCENTNLNLSLWVADFHSDAGAAAPKLELQLLKAADSSILYKSGICTPTRTSTLTWHQFGFSFTLSSAMDVIFRIVNKNDDGNGNDFGIDDIKVIYCGGQITKSPSTQAQNTICTGSDLPMTYTVTFDDPLAHVTTAYQWQKTTTPAVAGSWTNIPGATTASYTLTNVTVANTGYYRMIVTEGGNSCFFTPAENIQVTVLPAFTAGTIASTGQTVCSGATPATIGSTTPASGGDNHITYEWRENGTAIASSNSATYTPAGDLSVGTHTFTRWAKDSKCNTTFTQSAGSYTVTVTKVLASASAAEALVYQGTANTLTVSPSGGTAPYTYLWSDGGGTGISMTTPTTLTIGSHTYTVTVTDDNGCTAVASVSFGVQVLVDINDFTQSICSGTAFTVAPEDVTDGKVPANTQYTWSAPIATALTGMAAGDHQSSVSNTLTNTSTTAQTVTYTVTPSVGSVTGHTFTIAVTVYAPVTSGSIKATMVTCATDTIKKLDNDVEGNGGDFKDYSWEYSIDGGSTWTPLSGPAYNVTGMVPDYSLFPGQAIFRRNYNTTSCGLAATNEITLNNPGNVSPGSITSASANPSSFCSGDAVNIKMKANPSIQHGSYAYSVRWQSSTDGGTTYTDIPGATDTTYIYNVSSITAPITFRYKFALTNCDTLNSNNKFDILLYENPSIVLSTTATCANEGSYTVNAVVTGGATPYTYLWSGNATGTTATGTVAQSGTNDCGTTYTASLKITDAHSCVVTESKSFTVGDNVVPTITGTIAEKTVEGCAAGDAPAAKTTVVDLEALGIAIEDNCTADAALTVTHTDVSSSTCPIVVKRTYKIEDACGNASTTSQVINVDDKTAPTITGLANVSVPTDAGKDSATVTIDLPTVSDLCGTVLYSHNSIYATDYSTVKQNASGKYPMGVNTVTYTAKDGCNNETTGSFTVTVTDNENPVITRKGNQEVCPEVPARIYTHSGTTWDATATDNGGLANLVYTLTGATSSITVSNTTLDGQIFNIGKTVVTWKATDYTGNFSTCKDTVTVDSVSKITDQTPTTICSASSVSLNATTFTGTNIIPANTKYTWTVASNTNVTGQSDNTTDSASFNTGVLTNTSLVPQTMTYTISTITGTCHGEDFTVTVLVNPKATVTAVENQTLCNQSWTTDIHFASPNGSAVTYNWTNNKHSIGLAATGTSDIDAFQAYNTGLDYDTATIVVTPTFTNGGVDCDGTPMSFKIIVKPTISSANSTFTCPDTLKITLDYGACDTVPALGMPVFNTQLTAYPMTDYTISNNSPGTFSVGETTVTWTVTDPCGFTMTCEQPVIVKFPLCGLDPVTNIMFPATIDGYDYPTVRVGCNCWTAENLHNTHYADGADIAQSTYYNEDPALLAEYGRLYPWNSTVRADADGNATTTPGGYVQGVCPDGWAVPTEADYVQLVTDAPGATMLKSADPRYWLGQYGGVTPNSGFNALPGGYYDNATHSYYNLLGEAHFWTTESVLHSNQATCSSLYYYCEEMMFETKLKDFGFSVRCIKKKE